MGVYAPSPGTIYPRLARLEEEGLVTHDGRDGRKVYRITEKGREELNARLDDLAELEEEITASVRDIAREVNEDVRETVRSLREELASASRDLHRGSSPPGGGEAVGLGSGPGRAVRKPGGPKKRPSGPRRRASGPRRRASGSGRKPSGPRRRVAGPRTPGPRQPTSPGRRGRGDRARDEPGPARGRNGANGRAGGRPGLVAGPAGAAGRERAGRRAARLPRLSRSGAARQAVRPGMRMAAWHAQADRARKHWTTSAEILDETLDRISAEVFNGPAAPRQPGEPAGGTPPGPARRRRRAGNRAPARGPRPGATGPTPGGDAERTGGAEQVNGAGQANGTAPDAGTP